MKLNNGGNVLLLAASLDARHGIYDLPFTCVLLFCADKVQNLEVVWELQLSFFCQNASTPTLLHFKTVVFTASAM